MDIGTFAGIFIALYVAHGIADHWLQTDQEVAHKGRSDRSGQLACLNHVFTYTLATTLAVMAMDLVFSLHLHWYWMLAGQLLSGATHYWADRRFTLQRFCERLGKGEFYRLGAPRELHALVRGDATRVDLVHAEVDEFGMRLPVKWDNPSLGTGAYMLDQWWHIGWLSVAAIVTVLPF